MISKSLVLRRAMLRLGRAGCPGGGTGWPCRSGGVRSPGRWGSAWPGGIRRDRNAGQDRGDNVVPEGEQGRYGPGSRAGQIVAAGARGFERRAACRGVGSADRRRPGGCCRWRGPARSWRGRRYIGTVNRREMRRGRARPPGRRGSGACSHRCRRPGWRPVARAAAADPACRRGGSRYQRSPARCRTAGTSGQPGDDLGKALQCPAAAQLAGVVGDRFEPEDARAFGVALECQQPENGL